MHIHRKIILKNDTRSLADATWLHPTKYFISYLKTRAAMKRTIDKFADLCGRGLVARGNGWKLTRRHIQLATQVGPMLTLLCGHPLTFDLVSWKLTHRLNVLWQTFATIVVCLRLFLFKQQPVHDRRIFLQTDRRTDGY